MLTSQPTIEMIEKWKSVFDKHKNTLNPNRKSGREVDEYFRSKYKCIALNSEKFKQIVTRNICDNEHSKRKLKGKCPIVKTYRYGNIMIGIDIVSGEFQVECVNIEKCVPIYDDLFVFRGLDEFDIKNYFLVAEYIRLKNL